MSAVVTVRHTRVLSMLQNSRKHGSFLKGFDIKCSVTVSESVQAEEWCLEMGKSLSENPGNGVSVY